MWYATQARESYPYYQHEAIGYNYRLSTICAGIGHGQMTIANEHIVHHKHLFELYKQLLSSISGIYIHGNPSPRYDSFLGLNTITLDPDIRIIGQDKACKEVVKGAVGGHHVLSMQLLQLLLIARRMIMLKPFECFSMQPALKPDHCGNRCISSRYTKEYPLM